MNEIAGVEIRMKGKDVDDVVVECPSLFRAERMDARHWWIAAYLGPAERKRLVMHFTIGRGGRIEASAEIEDL
jgi:hypothetical protein